MVHYEPYLSDAEYRVNDNLGWPNQKRVYFNNWDEIEVPQDDGNPLEEEAIRKEEYKNLYDALSTLTTTERRVIKLRFGFVNDTDYTYEEVAKLLGIDRKTVMVHEEAAIEKLRQVLNPEASKRARYLELLQTILQDDEDEQQHTG